MSSRLSKMLLPSVALCSGVVFAVAEKAPAYEKKSTQPIVCSQGWVLKGEALRNHGIDPGVTQQFQATLDAFVKEGQEKSKEGELKEKMALAQKIYDALEAIKEGDKQAMAELFVALEMLIKMNQEKISTLERENRWLRVSSSLEKKKESTFDTAVKYLFVGGFAAMMIPMTVMIWRDALRPSRR